MEMAPALRFYGRPLHPYSRALAAAAGGEDFLLRVTDAGVPAGGCPLTPRCPLAIDRCRAEKPLLRPVEDSLVACHRTEEALVLPSPGGD